jgi:hypothetical protein
MAGRCRVPLDHSGQLGPDRLELGHLGVDLGHPLTQQRLAMPTRAEALVADGQQLSDLAQPEADPLGALDEPQPLNRLLGVLAVTSRGPLRRRLSCVKNLAGSACVASGSLAGRPVALASLGEALELPCVHVAHPFPAMLGRWADPRVVGNTAVTQGIHVRAVLFDPCA